VTFYVVSGALVATHRCRKLISAAVNQHATIEEAVFSVGAAPRQYNEDLGQLELELSRVPDFEMSRHSRAELSYAKICDKRWQLQ
jgi:hypothetical protein